MHHRLFFDYMYLSSLFSAISSKYLKYQHVRHITTRWHKFSVFANNLHDFRALLMLIAYTTILMLLIILPIKSLSINPDSNGIDWLFELEHAI